VPADGGWRGAPMEWDTAPKKPWNIIERVAVPLSGKLLVTLF
jgi:hypothetical protein